MATERECLPARRRAWTQRASVAGQTAYLSFGEYPDGRLGEVWLEVAKENTFLRGMAGALCRTVSVALQCGTPVGEVVRSLRGLSFPPQGAVEGSPSVTHCTSLPDWMAQEIEAAYVRPEKPAGHASQSKHA